MFYIFIKKMLSGYIKIIFYSIEAMSILSLLYDAYSYTDTAMRITTLGIAIGKILHLFYSKTNLSGENFCDFGTSFVNNVFSPTKETKRRRKMRKQK